MDINIGSYVPKRWRVYRARFIAISLGLRFREVIEENRTLEIAFHSGVQVGDDTNKGLFHA